MGVDSHQQSDTSVDLHHWPTPNGGSWNILPLSTDPVIITEVRTAWASPTEVQHSTPNTLLAKEGIRSGLLTIQELG